MGYIINPYWIEGGGASLPLADRWRIVALGNQWDSCWLAEIEMAQTAAGADECTGGTPTDYGSTGTIANLFDNNTGTSYQTGAYNVGTTRPGYVFASALQIAEVRLTADATRGAAAPTAFAIQASLDAGVTWNTYGLHITHGLFANGEQKSFAVDPTPIPTGLGRTNARAWRVNVSNNNGASWTQIGELRMATSAGGADICTGGAPYCNGTLSHVFADRSPAAAFDNNTATGAQSNATNNMKLGYVFPGAQDIYEVRMTISTLDTNGGPLDFTVEYTEDFVNWTVANTFTGVTGWSAGTYKTFVV